MGDLLNPQESLVSLAQQTGGFAVLNPNDLVGGLGRIIDDTRGYCLLGFDTSIPAADRWDPNDTRVHVIRAAVQDDRSRAVGTSAQFVEVPNVGKDVIARSGVVMMDVASAGADTAEAMVAAGVRTDVIADGVLGEPAIKIFKPRSEVAYTFEIYDGRDKRKEGFSTRATLIRDGKAFYTTPQEPVGAAPQDVKPVGSVPVGGTLSLGSKLPRGTYTLQVSVAPNSGKGRNRPASQWVDVEVRR